jgi:predicted nucleic acid-binding protein
VTVTVDINVLLDVFERRQPHFVESARVLSMVAAGSLTGVLPAHGLTTLYYLVRKHASKTDAKSAMDRVLNHFEIGNLDVAGWGKARQLPMDDFEDAVVAPSLKSPTRHLSSHETSAISLARAYVPSLLRTS